jgi:hypothetical protein
MGSRLVFTGYYREIDFPGIEPIEPGALNEQLTRLVLNTSGIPDIRFS